MKGQIFLFLFISTLLFKCSNSTSPILNDSEFGIYFLKETLINSKDAMEKPLENLELQSDPILDIEDIISYNWGEHTIEVSSINFEKIKNIENKIKSTYGLPFVVAVGKDKIYLGNFFPLYSSLMYMDLPHINVAPLTEIKIYKAPLDIEDKRNDERIYSVLKENGKLKN
jgi:hypothetical protein